MAQIFTTYSDNYVPNPPINLALELQNMTAQQKLAILDASAESPVRNPLEVKAETGVKRKVVVALYRAIKFIVDSAIPIMRQRILISPAVIDSETGEETSPAVYNDKPTDATSLRNALKPIVDEAYPNVFADAALLVVVNKILEVSARDENGDYVGTFETYDTGVTGG